MVMGQVRQRANPTVDFGIALAVGFILNSDSLEESNVGG